MRDDHLPEGEDLAEVVDELRRHVSHGLIIAVVASFLLGVSATLIIVQVLLQPWPALPIDLIPLFSLTTVSVMVLIVHIIAGSPAPRARLRRRSSALASDPEGAQPQRPS